MISVPSLALGYLIMNLFLVSGNLSGDVCSTLFGSTSILTLTSGEVMICALFSAVVMVIYLVYYREIFRISFDEEFAEATGTRVSALNTFLAGIIAVTVVLAMELVGSLLISALVIFPAVTAMQIFSDFRRVSIFSAVIGAFGTAAGILIAILAGTPVGSTIAATDLMIFLMVLIGGRMRP
ncbi:metal ABC transporter permease [Stecheria intestinalis]|nr:iron chelate uptake ABC transporter family permease subunit [Stecheria intestinalis]